MKIFTIFLPDHVAHKIEVKAAIDNKRPPEAISELLVYLVENMPIGTKLTDYDFGED